MKSSGIGGQEKDEAVVRTPQSDVVPAPAPAQTSEEPRTSVSRVLSVGTANRGYFPVMRPGPGRLPTDDAVTTVDGAFEPLTREQREALARRIRTELENTRPMGTPKPATVQAATATPTHPFKQTMLLGVARPASSSPPAPPSARSQPPEPAASPDSDVSSLRASFVRVVGPPRSPPPRRSRRSGPPLPGDLPAEGASRAPESEPEHEAFQLDRRSSTSLPAAVVPPPTVRSAAADATSVMLPPPPGAGDYEPSTPAPFPPVVVRSELPLADLPSVDPFAGFVARPPSWFERWLVVLVVALALVGAAALAAVAFGYLGRPGN